MALTGHPSAPDDIGLLKYFDIPGQDVVWRYAEPDKLSAIEGEQSTQCKCASSAMLHYGRRRNLNEYAGAYGHDLTRDEFDWLMRWAAVRGCNLFVPHAFYYSTRGPRGDERPPDVGPNSPWWDTFKLHADEARRLAWLNDHSSVCDLAILGQPDWLPWEAAKVCFQNQFAFEYLDVEQLRSQATIDSGGIWLGDWSYNHLIVQGSLPTDLRERLGDGCAAGRLIEWRPDAGDAVLANWLTKYVREGQTLVEPACPALRVRWSMTASAFWVILFNEEKQPIDFRFNSAAQIRAQVDERGCTIIDPATDERVSLKADEVIHLDGHALRVLFIPFDTR